MSAPASGHFRLGAKQVAQYQSVATWSHLLRIGHGTKLASNTLTHSGQSSYVYSRRNRRPINTLDDSTVVSEGRRLLSVHSATFMHCHLQSPTPSSFYRLETQRKEPQSQNHETPCPHPCPRCIPSLASVSYSFLCY